MEMSDINRDRIGGIKNIDITTNYIEWCPVFNDFKQLDGVDKYIIKGFAPKSPFIDKNSKIVAIGSCFVQNIIKHLVNKKYIINKGSVKLYFYTAEFINTFALREQIEWINGELEVDQILWFNGLDRIESKKVSLTENERKKSRKEIEGADVFILSPGIIEIWKDKTSGRVLWRKTLKEKDNSSFEISSFNDNKINLLKIYDGIRKINKRCKIILMANPITLNATFRDNSIFVSDCVSKSIMRGVVDEIYREKKNIDENIFYWPSYEILFYYGFFVENLYRDDMRHPKDDAIEMVMGYFDKYYLKK